MKQVISSCNITDIALSKKYSQVRNSNMLLLHSGFTNKIHYKIVIVQVFAVLVEATYRTEILQENEFKMDMH